MLIDKSYFAGDLDIAGTSSTHVAARLQWFIDKYEPKFLRLLFGPLYQAYLTGVAASPVDAKWTALQTDGLKNAVACYIYYWFTRDAESKTTGLGEAKPVSENSKMVGAGEKMCRAWGEMQEEVGLLYQFLDANAITYPEWNSSYRYGYATGGRYERNELFGNVNMMNL